MLYTKPVWSYNVCRSIVGTMKNNEGNEYKKHIGR